MHDVVGSADRVDIARSRHALDFSLERMGNALQFMGAPLLILRPQRQGDRGNVIDAFRFDDRLQHTGARRHPVLVRVHGVVEPHDGSGAILTHLVLDGQHRHAGTRHRVRMLDALDLGQHLFERNRDEVFDLDCTSARERHEDVRKGHVDLRFFLARRDRHGEQAHEQPRQRQQRRDLGVLEALCDRAREPELIAVRHELLRLFLGQDAGADRVGRDRFSLFQACED